MPMWLPIFFQRIRADIDAVDEDCAFGDVVKAANQVDDRGLARAAVADQPDHFAGLEF